MTTPTGNDGTQPHNLPNGYDPYPSSYPTPAGDMNQPPASWYQPQPGSYPTGPYGSDPYTDGPGFGGAPAPLNVNGRTVVTGDGQAPIVSTIMAGFSGVFIRPWAFIGYQILAMIFLGVIIIAGLLGIGSLISDLQPGDIVPSSAGWLLLTLAALTGICVILYQTVMSNGALQAAEGRRVTFRDLFIPRYGFRTPIIVALLVGVISALGAFLQLPAFHETFTNLKVVDIEGSGLGIVPNTGEISGLTALSLLVLPVQIIVWLATPLFMFAPLVALDQGTSVKDSFVFAARYARPHWLRLIGYAIMLNVTAAVLSGITLTIGLIVIIPAVVISQAVMYRRVSGGLHIAVD